MNRFTNPPSENPPSQQEMSFSGVSELSSNVQDNAQESEVQEHKPIPIPSHARQYRAIGLIEAKYERSEEQLTKGTLITSTDKNIDAVVLGRLISLFKKRIDLEKQHLWVVYPRTNQDSEDLHVQIVGIWEPQTFKKDTQINNESDLTENEDHLKPGYFSIRGEVVFASQETETIIVKIRQSAKKDEERPKFFKIKIKGKLPDKPVSHFWDLEVQLVDTVLILREATDLGFVPKKKRTFNSKPIIKKSFDKPVQEIDFSSDKPRPKPRNRSF